MTTPRSRSSRSTDTPFIPVRGPGTRPGRGEAWARPGTSPIPHGTSRGDYRAAFRSALEEEADRSRPQLILLSAGFDAHAEDPVGDLGLEVEDFEGMTREVLDVAEAHAGGRLVSVLEGGYNVPILAGCVAAHLQALGAESY